MEKYNLITNVLNSLKSLFKQAKMVRPRPRGDAPRSERSFVWHRGRNRRPGQCCVLGWGCARGKGEGGAGGGVVCQISVVGFNQPSATTECFRGKEKKKKEEQQKSRTFHRVLQSQFTESHPPPPPPLGGRGLGRRGGDVIVVS